MELNNNLQKQIGIVVSILIFAMVFGVTVFTDRNLTTQPVTDQSSDHSTESTVESTVQNTAASTLLSQSPAPATHSKTSVTSPVDVPKKTAFLYKNGNYTATGLYMSPGGEEQIAVSLTLKNDIITAVSVTPEAEDNTSIRYQDKFISGYKAYVVGKNIADVNLGRISGSSLTPIGFNNALARIKTQAKV